MVAYLLGLTEYLFGLAVLSTWSLRCSAKTQIGNPLLGTARLRLHVGQFIIPLPFATPTKTHVTLWKAWSMHVNSCGLIQHVSGAYLRVWLYRKTSPLYSIPNVLTVVFFNPKTIFLKKGGYATFPCYPWSTHVPWLEFKSSWLLFAKASTLYLQCCLILYSPSAMDLYLSIPLDEKQNTVWKYIFVYTIAHHFHKKFPTVNLCSRNVCGITY